MDISQEVSELIGGPQGLRLEYKAVLPPARTVAQLICSFANAEGGFIVLGVAEMDGKITINGLSEEFRATAITHKALDLLSPKPAVDYQYIVHAQKRLYVIKIGKSDTPITSQGSMYVRKGAHSVLKQPTSQESEARRYPKIETLSSILKQYKEKGTGAKVKFLDHYQSILNICDSLPTLLYPESGQKPTTNQEGKVLMRVLFSSCADTFETYLSDLLYEIYLAQPATLKSGEQVTVKEVLDCTDMQEFVDFYAKKKLAKLQRGSIKGFIADTSQISGLGVFDADRQGGIEKLLQIRHLYSHRNGVVDERFLRYYPDLRLNEEHLMSLDDFLERFEYFAQTVDAVDRAALIKYQLASFD
ncbi:MAG TPA: ATP-binding protein [Terriglobales bacterium]|nr:ATP-binding protein [Terriglobales bacterium]